MGVLAQFFRFGGNDRWTNVFRIEESYGWKEGWGLLGFVIGCLKTTL